MLGVGRRCKWIRFSQQDEQHHTETPHVHRNAKRVLVHDLRGVVALSNACGSDTGDTAVEISEGECKTFGDE